MNQLRQDAMGRRYDALVPGEMRRTEGKDGTSTGWVLVVNVDEDEIRRLRPLANGLHGDAGLLRHPGGVTFAVSPIEAGAKRYIFVLPLVGPEVLAMVRLMSVTGFRVAFSCGTHDVLRFAFPVAVEAANDYLASHLRRYSKDAVLAAASDVALHLLKEADLKQSGDEHLVCMVATPGLQAWAARHHRHG